MQCCQTGKIHAKSKLKPEMT